MSGILLDPKDVPAELRQYFEEVEVQCGAPWRRRVERVAAVPDSYNGSTFTNGKTGAVHDTRGQGPRYTTTATGEWEPSCNCGTTETRPCLVCDPFMGSGTTAAVAVEENRAWVGCDLDARAAGWLAGRLARVQRRLPLAV
jgi:hypothetical protein